MADERDLKHFAKMANEMECKSKTSSLMDGNMVKFENTNPLPNQSTISSHLEISDKVLFEQATVAMEEHYGYGCETEIDAYFRGAKWMQKQFKQQD